MSRRTSGPLQQDRHRRLTLEKLEDRNLLATISGDCGPFQPAPMEFLAVNVDYVNSRDKWSTATSMELRTSGDRFVRQPYANIAASGNLGVLEDQFTVQASQGYFDWIDRYEFEIQQKGELDVSLEFEHATLSMLLVYNEQRQLVMGDFTGASAHAKVTGEVEAGTYFVLVFRGHGKYQLDLQLHNEPPAAEFPGNVPPANQPQPPRTPDPGTPTNPSTPIDNSPSPQPLNDVSYYGGTYDWNLNAVKAPEAWNAGYLGDDIVVAVIDTGVNINHNDLNNNIWLNTDEIAGDGIDNDGNGYVDDRYGWNFVGQSANVQDDNGHGTHVAGTIAAEQNSFGATGVAPNAEIMSIKALDSQGSGFFSAIARGIRYAVDNGADIINLSLGGSYSSLIESAISYAASNDVLVVAASGNEGSSTPGQPASLSNNYSNVLSVGAYDSRGAIAGFSNGVGNSGAVQVDAPGVSIYSTSNSGGYRWLSGTSMATPHVAGLAALTLSANPNLSAANLRNIIVTSSNRTAQGSDAFGAVNAAVAIPQALAGGSTVLPVTAAARAAIDSGNQAGSLQLEADVTINHLIHVVSVERHAIDSLPPDLPIADMPTPLRLASLDVAHESSDSWLEAVERSQADVGHDGLLEDAFASFDDVLESDLELIAI